MSDNENKLQERARGAAQTVKEHGSTNQPVATTGGKDAGNRRVRVSQGRNARGVNFPDGDGGVLRFAAGSVHSVPAELADAVDAQGNRYFDDVEEKEDNQ